MVEGCRRCEQWRFRDTGNRNHAVSMYGAVTATSCTGQKITCFCLCRLDGNAGSLRAMDKALRVLCRSIYG